MNELQGYSQDELLQLLEEQQTEIESLNQKNTELEQTAQYLTERLESLSGSDLLLQSVKREKENFQKEKKEFQEYVERAQEEITRNTRMNDLREERLSDMKQRLDERKNDMQSEINRKTNEKFNSYRQEDKKNKKFLLSYIAVMLASATMSLFMIGMWCGEHPEVIYSAGQWLIDRLFDFGNLCILLMNSMFWWEEHLPQAWSLMYVGIAVGAYFLIRCVIRRFKAWNDEVWDYYSKNKMKQLKTAHMALICGIAFIVSIKIAEVTSINWLPLMLSGAVAANLIYHIYGSKKAMRTVSK